MNQIQNTELSPGEDQSYLSNEDRRILFSVIRFVIGLTLIVNLIVFGVIFLVNH